MGNYFAYMRISTKQERGIQQFTRQEATLSKYCKDNDIEFLLEFREDESGKSFTNRKEWMKLEKLVQPGDTIVFKDISRFTREAENGYKKYMELMDRGIELIFLDNQTVSTPYIKQLLQVAERQNLVAKVSLESTVKLLLIVELDRVEQERLIFIKRVKDGIAASPKKSGRPIGHLDKLTPQLRDDIVMFLDAREKNMTAKKSDLMKKHSISRTTLSKYISVVAAVEDLKFA